MKLSDIKKNADAKAAEVEAARKHAQQKKELDVHPLLKWGCDRSVRDAYFCGIVFAAVSDEDNVVDKYERKLIDRIGRSLALSEVEVNEFVEVVTKTVRTAISGGGNDVFAVLEEAAAALKDEKVFRLFVAEYMKVCGANEVGDSDDVWNQLTTYVSKSAGVNLDSRSYKVLGRYLGASNEIQDSDLVALAAFLGDDTVRYLLLDSIGDVAGQLKSARKSLAAKAKSRAEKARLERTRKAFEDALTKIGEKYKECGVTPVDWDDDIQEQMAPFDSVDIDWVASVNDKLNALRRIPHCYSMLVGRREMVSRRKLVWKLVGMLWVAEIEIYSDKVNNLLRVARQLSTEAYNEKIESFIQESFDGVVELE